MYICMWFYFYMRWKISMNFIIEHMNQALWHTYFADAGSWLLVSFFFQIIIEKYTVLHQVLFVVMFCCSQWTFDCYTPSNEVYLLEGGEMTLRLGKISAASYSYQFNMQITTMDCEYDSLFLGYWNLLPSDTNLFQCLILCVQNLITLLLKGSSLSSYIFLD